MKKRESHTVPELDAPIHLSNYVPGVFRSIATRKGMKKAIKKGLVLVNGEPGQTGTWITGGEQIDLFFPDNLSEVNTYQLDLKIVYEDDHLAIVNKPAGIVVSGNQFRTLENALPGNLQPSSLPDALLRPQPIHRLDYPTSGLVLVGKTSSATVELNNMFAQRLVRKEYLAVTIGEMEKRGGLTTPVDGKEAYCSYHVWDHQPSARFGRLNLVYLKPRTGRKHQLRAQLLAAGNPILGDKEYGLPGKILHGKGLYLHAMGLTLKPPFLHHFISEHQDPPKKFLKIFPPPESPKTI